MRKIILLGTVFILLCSIVFGSTSYTNNPTIVCGNCTFLTPGSSGGGNITGSGTVNTVAMWLNGTNLGNSVITQSGNTITVSGPLAANVFQGKINWSYVENVTDSSLVLALNSSNVSTNLRINVLNASKAGAGNCPAGQVVQNTTTSGVQCITSTAGSGNASASGSNGQVAFFNTTNTLISNPELFWDETNKRLGVGTSAPNQTIDINGTLKVGPGTNFGFLSSGYMLVSSLPAQDAGVLLHRGDTNAYASFDFVQNDDTSTGWSLQMQPSSDDFVVYNRVNGFNQMKFSTSTHTFISSQDQDFATQSLVFYGYSGNGLPGIALANPETNTISFGDGDTYSPQTILFARSAGQYHTRLQTEYLTTAGSAAFYTDPAQSYNPQVPVAAFQVGRYNDREVQDPPTNFTLVGQTAGGTSYLTGDQINYTVWAWHDNVLGSDRVYSQVGSQINVTISSNGNNVDMSWTYPAQYQCIDIYRQINGGGFDSVASCVDSLFTDDDTLFGPAGSYPPTPYYFEENPYLLANPMNSTSTEVSIGSLNESVLRFDQYYDGRLYANMTADRKWYLPNKNGTIALLSDITAGSGGNPFNQTLNTSDRVTFFEVNVTNATTFKQFARGIELYNTPNQTTNYEKLEITIRNNVSIIGNNIGVGGTVRDLVLGVASNGGTPISTTSGRILKIGTGITGGIGFYDFNWGGTGLPNGTIISMRAPIQGTSLVQNIMGIYPDVNQSGTAMFRGLYISPFMRTNGSGGTYLIDAGTNAATDNGGLHTSVFNVNTSGQVKAAGRIIAPQFLAGNDTSLSTSYQYQAWAGAGGTYAAFRDDSVTQSGETVGTFSCGSTDSGNSQSCWMRGIAVQDYNGSAAGTNLTFATTQRNSNTPSTDLTITSDNKVDVNARLQVQLGNTTQKGGVTATAFDSETVASNVGTAETQLYLQTIPNQAFEYNGDRVSVTIGGNVTGSGTATKQLKLYLMNSTTQQLVFDTGAITFSTEGDFVLETTAKRVNATSVTITATLNTASASLGSYAKIMKGVTLNLNQSLAFNFTGTSSGAGAGSGDITFATAFGDVSGGVQ